MKLFFYHHVAEEEAEEHLVAGSSGCRQISKKHETGAYQGKAQASQSSHKDVTHPMLRLERNETSWPMERSCCWENVHVE